MIFGLAMAHVWVPVIVGVSIALMLVRPRGLAEVWWISGGVVLLLVLRLVPLRLAGHAVGEGADVYLFLTGMMLLSELAREQGVFDWVSSLAVRKARKSCSRLFLLVYAVGTVVTVLLSNDATAVVLTPAILSAVRKAKVAALPYLFVCAMIANAASFVLPISNPANLVVFHTHMPGLGEWMASFAVPSLVSIAVTYAVMRWLFRKELRGRIEHEAKPVALTANGKLVLAGLGLTVGVLLAASAMDKDLGLPTCVCALAIVLGISAWAKQNPVKLFREVSWSTLLLVAGLFVMVDAIEAQGALRLTGAWLQHAAALVDSAAALVVGCLVGVANNLVNNLPLGLIAGATLQTTHTQGLLQHAVLIAVDLGPNLSVTGSLATILWLLAVRRDNAESDEKIEVSFWSFLKVGAVAMPAALVAALGSAVLLHRLTGR
jgi:arsenical pump membrane protein